MNIDGKEGTLILDLSDPKRLEAFARGEPLPPRIWTCAHCQTVFEEQIERDVHESKCRGRGAVASIVSIRKQYDIQLTEPVPGHWRAIERVTYDPDPESPYHVEGWGKDTEEAMIELMQGLAALTVREAFENRVPL